MKKHLLLVLSLCFALVTTAADLNPYAYNLSSEIALNNPMRLNISFKLNASALSVKVFVYTVDGEWEQEVNANLTNSTLTYTGYIDLSVVPAEYRGRDLKWRVDVYGEDRDDVESVGKVIAVKIPLSLDIDNNPESPYFGRIIVSQSTNNVANNTQGLYLYDPQDLKNTKGNTTNGGIRCFPSGITPSTEGWYTKYHAIPYRVRIAQDGTGNIFATACDKSQTAYLWYINPASPENGNSWKQILTTANVDAAAGGPDANLWNVGLDIREDGNNYKLLLLSTTTGTNTSFVAGYIYSGEYTLSKLNIDSHTFNQSNYTSLSKYNTSTKKYDSEVKGGLVAHALRSSIAYDKNGGVWYTGTTIMDDYKTMSGVIHRTTSGTWKTDYATSWEALQRQYIFSGGIRHNKQFDKVVITNGSTQNTEKQALLFTVNYGASNPTLSNPVWLPKLITPSSGNHVAYTDVAWDYAGNIYLCAGYDGTSHDYGIYAVATDLNGEAVSTEVRDTYIFTVECDGSNCTVIPQSNNVSWGTVSGGGTQISCTEITVVATPTDGNKYRFMHWKDENDNIVSTNATYTFMVVRDITLTAVFEYAEYTGISWHNLLIGETPEGDKYDIDTNQELWEMMMRAHNEYVYDSIVKNDFRNKTIDYWTTAYYRGSQEINLITTFFDPTYGQAALVGFMTSPTSPFKWLGDYILEKTGETSFTKQFWAVNIAGFFNCNQLTQTWSNVSYTSKDYATIGTPSEWLPYYRAGICGLEHTMTYTEKMPISIDSLTLEHNGTFPYNNGTTSTVTRSTRPTWYIHEKNEDHTLLLAWRNGSTEGKIEHNISDNNMSLYATWVNKHIQENDPNDEASNYDVITLMKNHTDATHNITVTRKLQGGMYNTICMPFTLDLTGLMNEHPLYGAKAYEFSSIDPLYDTGTNEPVTVLNFTEENILEAGKPYLIKPLKDVTEDMLFTGVSRTDLTLEPQSKTVIYGDNELKITFHGVINPTDIPAGALMVVADNRLAVNTVDNSTMKGMRGYFTIDFSSLAAQEVQEQALDGRVYLSFKKPVTTSVPIAPEAEQPTTPKVEKIMRDGQIYIIRDGVTYTITGARVR